MTAQIMPAMTYQIHHAHVVNTNSRGKWQLAKQKSPTLFKGIVIQRVVSQTDVDYTWIQQETAGS